MNRIEDVYGLTPAQEGIYTQYFQNNKTDAYQLFFLFELDETASVEILRQAMILLPVRHPVLKTAFAVVKGTLKQVLLTDRIPDIETRDMGTSFTRTALDEAVRKEKTHTFDLQKDPLLRCVFFLFSDKRFLLLHTHHLIADGWCMPVLLEDLLSCAAALAAGESVDTLQSRLTEERRKTSSFADYVNLIRRRDTDTARAYWSFVLSDCVPAPLPRNTGNHGSAGGTQTLSFDIPSYIRDQTERLARANGMPPNAVLESAFALALHKHTGKNSVLFFKVISGRTFGLPGGERTVGPMMNTVPVRAKAAGDETPLRYMQDMNEQSIRTNEFGFLSLSDVCRENGIDPNNVDVLFDYGNYLVPEFGTGIPLHLQEHSERTEFPLTCILSPDRNGYHLTILWDETRLSASFVLSFKDSFLSILNRLCASDEKRLQDESCLSGFLSLSGNERDRLGVFSAGPVVPIPEKSVYELFEEQAAGTDTAQIRDGEKTYALCDLKTAAEKVDLFIRSRTGDKKQVIGVLCDRSFAQLAAIYGIVRGGSAYLPLSPDFPPERIRILLEKADCSLVLADGKYLSLTEKAVSVGSILAAAAPAVVPAPAAVPDDTLYVIFTSGSTGTPKGAMVTNRSAVNRIGWMADRYWDKDTVVMLKTPYTFDVSVWEIFGFAISGFSLQILPPEAHYSMSATLNAVAEGRVTDMHFVPTVFGSFLEHLKSRPEEREKLRSLKNVFLSGETLHASSVNEFASFAPAGAKIHNLYGPAECAVDVTFFDCDKTEEDPVPIGKPIQNTRIYVLDKYLQPVPVGVTGQICIAGTNVGQGYLGGPALTTEKFIDDPYGEGKMYLTGDLGYWREDGNLVFVGRNDFQVKINGQRVELGEIETALAGVDGVTNACVIKKNSPDRLALFYTGSAQENAVADSLARLLPPYMRPSEMIRLDALPLNASGKADRKALSALVLPETETHPSAPPETETEKAICEAFSQTLGIPEVGRYDSFFELGGTSIQVIRLLSVPPLDALSPSAILADPTPFGLAKRLDGPNQTDYTVLAPLYTPDDAKRAIVLFSYAGGDATAYTAFITEFRHHQSDTSLWYIPWLNEEQYSEAANEIISLSHSMEIRFYSHCAGAVTALKLLDLVNRNDPVVKQLIAGGNIPPVPGKKATNIWQHLSDKSIAKILHKAGLEIDISALSTYSDLISRFRCNTNEFFLYVSSKDNKKTNISVDLIISKKDLFTLNYRNAKKRWSYFVRDVCSVRYIKTKTHYFQAKNANQLFSLFQDALKIFDER